MNAWKSTLLFCVLIWALRAGIVAPTTVHAQAATNELRTWKAKDGGFSTEAALLAKKGESVVLERKDGQVISVPSDKLSLDDRVYVSEFVKKTNLAQSGSPSSPAKPATEAAPATVGPGDAFNAESLIKAWNRPREPFQLTVQSVIPLKLKPDVLEFSANGAFLYAVYFKEAKHLIYGTQDGKLIQTINYGTAPLTAAAITPDGRHLVATLADKRTGVYDLAAKIEVFVHPDIKHVNVLQTTTGKNTFILGSQSTGEFYRYRLLDKFGAAFPPPPETPAEVDPNSRTEVRCKSRMAM
jgi:WD40 repeat protein